MRTNYVLRVGRQSFHTKSVPETRGRDDGCGHARYPSNWSHIALSSAAGLRMALAGLHRWQPCVQSPDEGLLCRPSGKAKAFSRFCSATAPHTTHAPLSCSTSHGSVEHQQRSAARLQGPAQDRRIWDSGTRCGRLMPQARSARRHSRPSFRAAAGAEP